MSKLVNWQCAIFFRSQVSGYRFQWSEVRNSKNITFDIQFSNWHISTLLISILKNFQFSVFSVFDIQYYWQKSRLLVLLIEKICNFAVCLHRNA